MTVANPYMSIILVNYNGLKDLGPCLESLKEQTYLNYEVIVVDNNSTDGSAEVVEINYPYVKVIKTGKNLGFGAGNNVGIMHSLGQYIVFTNYDVEFDPDWLLNMVNAATGDDIGLVAPKILLYDDRSRVNTCGLTFQFTGHAFSRGGNRLSSEYTQRERIACVTGCAFLIKREVLDKIGLFDEEYHKFGPFFHSSLEDIDLSWRAQLAGYAIMFEPKSIMFHKYIQKPLTPLRFYYLECGRYYVLLKCYSTITLMVMLPVLVFTDIIGFSYVMLKGRQFVLEKLKAYVWILGHISKIMLGRAKIKKYRKITDYELIGHFSADTDIRHSPIPPPLAKLILSCINMVYRIYKRGILSILKLGQLTRQGAVND